LAVKRIDKYEYFLLNRVGKTISDCEFIENNLRNIVAVSGGKESLSLLRLLTVKGLK